MLMLLLLINNDNSWELYFRSVSLFLIQKKKGKFCDKDLDECQHMPCKNNGSCLNNIGAYRCDCPMGYQGNDCSLDVDECIYAPCLNRGICINHPGGYKCQCHLGYEGDVCWISF